MHGLHIYMNDRYQIFKRILRTSKTKAKITAMRRENHRKMQMKYWKEIRSKIQMKDRFEEVVTVLETRKADIRSVSSKKAAQIPRTKRRSANYSVHAWAHTDVVLRL